MIAHSAVPAKPLIILKDIPPRKPLKWFAAGATLIALPIGLLARRRVRKLQALAV